MTTTRIEKYRVPAALVCYLCGWSDPEIFQTAVDFLRVMQLSALPEIRFENTMTDSDIQQLATKLDNLGQLQQFVQV